MAKGRARVARRTTRTAEQLRLDADGRREENWKRWGPYLSERQWSTVREDYSPDGSCWKYFPHDHARSRAYRWGEDGLLGFTDRECRLCFAVALWNGKDPILKERLFGLDNEEGNHGEDVKELYWYLAATPTYSYCRSLYRYPQAEFPYARLVDENRRRGKQEREFEILDTGVFDEERYFDVEAEYAKAAPDDVLIRLAATNRGPDRATLHLLPTIWLRNTWSWGCLHEGCWVKPSLHAQDDRTIAIKQATLGHYVLAVGASPRGRRPELYFTENETNLERVFGAPNAQPYVKDAFHRRVVVGDVDAVDPRRAGTKAAAHHVLDLAPGQTIEVRLRMSARDVAPKRPFGPAFERILAQRRLDYERHSRAHEPERLSAEERNVMRQARAGLLFSKQFYHYVVRDWLSGDPNQPPLPPQRRNGRNAEWLHLFNRDVLSVPDKWEYPWYAAWDLAFHMLPFARVDADFAKEQLVLFLREWYMHPNGQIPAYEFALGDVNPPVHAWATWRVYKMTAPRGQRDRTFLARCFQKLLLNFTWWVNRKDVEGRNIFGGGFLGLDNIGLFDRGRPLPGGARLEQADGTAWMAFYCATMMSMALELAQEDPAYEDVASKFFEHFVAIVDAMNSLGGSGLWNEEDGYYYDQIHLDGELLPLKVRSLVGVIPLFAVEVLEKSQLDRLPGFKKRMRWFLENRFDLARHIAYFQKAGPSASADPRRRGAAERLLLAVPSRERLERVLARVLDESELLSPFGVRSLSRAHQQPVAFDFKGERHEIVYDPGDSTTALFGGNSNWRGPVWFPLNFLLIEALERYHHFYGDDLKVECPTGSGRRMHLGAVAHELSARLVRLFLPDASGRRPCLGDDSSRARLDSWRSLVPFHEYFHGETGRGLGASHQTGWTALVAVLLEAIARAR